MTYTLSELNPLLKKLIFMILFVLTIGMSVGLYFVKLNTGTTPKDVVTHYNGSDGMSEDEFEISYAKNMKEITLTVHNHILSFLLIFTVLGVIFYGVSSIHSGLKEFLLIEPFISIIMTFGSMYLIRFVNADFVYLMIISSSLMYLSFFVMVFFSIRELFFVNR